MKHRIKFSIQVVNLSPTKLEEVMSTYEYEGKPSMHISNRKKSKPGPVKKEKGLNLPGGQIRVSRKAEYRIIKKSYSHVTARTLITSCQAMVKLRALENRVYQASELKKYIVAAKGVANPGAASSMITQLRRGGFLELVQ